MKGSSNVRRLLSSAAVLATMVAGTALADDAATAPTVRTVHVRYEDLNLSSQAGSERLYRRITNAAREACSEPDPRDLAGWSAARKCESLAVAKAVADLNSPQLAMVFAAHSRHG